MVEEAIQVSFVQSGDTFLEHLLLKLERDAIDLGVTLNALSRVRDLAGKKCTEL